MTKLDSLVAKIRAQAKPRFLLGITGPPGSGKSTLSETILKIWNETDSGTTDNGASIVPMDGYHLPNEELQRLGILHLKGIPQTFDAIGFVSKLRAIRSNPELTHYCPRFDRSIEASIQNDILVKPEDALVIVEGNYLLLDENPWKELANIFDAIWYIDADDSILLPRLLERHLHGGKTAEQAKEKVESTDVPNTKLIQKTRDRASLVLRASDMLINNS